MQTRRKSEHVEKLDDLALADLEQALRVLRVLQAPYASAFWDFEKAIARLSDEIERRRL